VSPKAVKLDFSRVSPIKGMKNLLSLKSLVRLLISVLKLSVIGVILWLYLSDNLGMLMSLTSATPGAIVSTTAELIGGVLIRIVIAMIAIAMVDLLYQKWNYKKELRMTKQEVKEEMKQYEISPQLKGRIRMLQREMASKRMLSDVPSADVVIVNPTHFAVALKYDSESMNAPEIVARGADLLCQRIKDLARENKVPIVERPRLARTLYASAKVGDTVPDTLFVAVAEVLAMIYKLRANRGMTGKVGSSS